MCFLYHKLVLRWIDTAYGSTELYVKTETRMLGDAGCGQEAEHVYF